MRLVLFVLGVYLLHIYAEPIVSIKTSKHKYETRVIEKVQTSNECPMAVVYNYESGTETILQPIIQITSRDETSYDVLLNKEVITIKMTFSTNNIEMNAKKFIDLMGSLLYEESDCLKVSQFQQDEIEGKLFSTTFWLLSCNDASPEQQLVQLNKLSQEDFAKVGLDNVDYREISGKMDDVPQSIGEMILSEADTSSGSNLLLQLFFLGTVCFLLF